MSIDLVGARSSYVRFPQEMRDAIPDFKLCAGRVLQLDSVDASPAGNFHVDLTFTSEAAGTPGQVLLDSALRAKEPRR